MRIEFDTAKRDATLRSRGLDIADAGAVLDGTHMTIPDVRFGYGEDRFVTVGFLSGRMVVLAWTPRGSVRRIISMRKANERERQKFGRNLGRP